MSQSCIFFLTFQLIKIFDQYIYIQFIKLIFYFNIKIRKYFILSFLEFMQNYVCVINMFYNE